MNAELIKEAKKLADVVEQMPQDQVMSLHLEPPFRTREGALTVKVALEEILQERNEFFKEITVAGEEHLQVEK